MQFTDVFNEVKNGLMGIDSAKLDKDFAVQVNLTGECAGVFYIANKNGKFEVEPFEYNDRNGAITMDSEVFMNMLDGKTSAEMELIKGRLKIEGNPIALMKVFKEAKAIMKEAEKDAKKGKK